MKKALLLATGLLATLGMSACSTTGATGAGANGQSGDLSSFGPIIIVYALLFAGLYFFMIRPNSKKKKQEEELRNNLEIGDELITIGGIMGRVVSIKDDDSFILETGPDRTRIHFKKWAISTIVTEKQQPETKDNKKAKKDSVEVKEK
ncbi:MAG: preprotein translocase subunit YajC [Acutalibacteraceae bacterium]|nr:preprotein translocase subunit YajC [Acutalibacteraceae bacterium]